MPIAVAGLLAAALAGCGSSGPTTAQLRATVRQYLIARTPATRCQLYTTTYRTQNPDVLLAGGCEHAEQIAAAQEAQRRLLTIGRVSVQDGSATVTLRASPTALRTAHASDGVLTGMFLVVEHGQWRINGFTASGQSSQTGARKPDVV